LLATSRPDDQNLIGKSLENLPDGRKIVDSWWAVTQGELSGEKILDVIIPVKQADGETIGLIRIYRRINDISQSFMTMRYLVLAVLLIGLLTTGGIAAYLAESISRPLRVFAETIENSPLEGQVQHLPEDGDGELSNLSRSYNRLQDRRLELEESRLLMLANLIHEIGRPLGSLRTAVHALQSGAADDKSLRIDLIKGMVERIDRIGRLLEDLALTYRQLDPQDIHVQFIQVNEWLEALSPLWAEIARQKHIEWKVDVQNDIPIIQTDPDRLAQALGNLVNNALKFTPPDGKVTLVVHQDIDNVVFQVSDTGIGIAFTDLQHLFTPFYRSVSPSWKTPGLGLGLSIAKSIIESLGGKISVVSFVGEGSTFSVKIPIR
jgi:signal transduction histidine kinase